MKRNYLFALITAAVMSSASLVFATSPYDTLILQDGASDYWPMQETTGPTFFDVAGTNNGLMYTSTDAGLGGNASDEHNVFAVAGANATDGGTYSLGVPGGPLANWLSSDTGVYFTNLNGQLSNSDIVISVYNAAMDSPIFTAEAWIYIHSYPIGYTNQFYQVPLGFEANGGSHSGWYFEVFDDREGSGGSDAEGNVLFNLAPSSHSGDNSEVTPHSLSGAGWTHVVEVYDGANLQCYYNGILIANTPETYSDVTEFPSHLIPMVIGSSCVSYFAISGGSENTGFERGFFWHGGISHVALYHTALTAGQVLNHYMLGVNGPTTPTPPVFATQPIGVTNYVGYSPSLSASASGSGVVYQWYQNSNLLSGQTNFTLNLRNLVLSNAGTYFLQASNGGGSVDSTNAIVDVLSLPSDPYQSNVIKLLPRAYYPMQDAGPAVSGVTPCVDLIGEGNNTGTYVAADDFTVPVLGAPGPGGSSDLGNSVTLDGTIPNGVFLNDPDAMDITGNSTMEVWIQVEDADDLQNIIEHGPAVEPNPSKTINYLGFDGVGDYYVGRYEQISNAFYDAFYPVPAGDVGQWVYLVGTSDGVGWHLYRNAQEVANLADTIGAIDANGGWAFGARDNMATPPNVIDPDGGVGLTGSINNIALYDHALTPRQILAHYQIGLTGATSPVTNSITIQADGLGDVILGWQYGTLQQAGSANGPWTDVVLALSPYTVAATNTTSFFRAVIK